VTSRREFNLICL